MQSIIHVHVYRERGGREGEEGGRGGRGEGEERERERERGRGRGYHDSPVLSVAVAVPQ